MSTVLLAAIQQAEQETARQPPPVRPVHGIRTPVPPGTPCANNMDHAYTDTDDMDDTDNQDDAGRFSARI